MEGVKLDGRLYRVRVVYNTLEQAFQLQNGPNEMTMLSGRHERDLLGTSYSYSFGVEADPRYPQDYDDFFWDISAPVDSHVVEMPSGQGVMTFEAEIQSGRRVYKGVLAGKKRWSGLEVAFTPIEPQRPAE